MKRKMKMILMQLFDISLSYLETVIRLQLKKTGKKLKAITKDLVNGIIKENGIIKLVF